MQLLAQHRTEEPQQQRVVGYGKRTAADPVESFAFFANQPGTYYVLEHGHGDEDQGKQRNLVHHLCYGLCSYSGYTHHITRRNGTRDENGNTISAEGCAHRSHIVV